jgi:NADPH:quinone reductase-like Zn-dependent oxidoreductase
VYPGFTPAALPAVPGLEGAGVIEDANGSAHAVGTRGTVFFNTKEVRMQKRSERGNGMPPAAAVLARAYTRARQPTPPRLHLIRLSEFCSALLACLFVAQGHGSWQQYVAVPAASFMPVPDSVSDESAAQFLVNPVTVVGMLEQLAAPAGEYILQSAAGSTLGRQFIALAKKQGVKTINLVRRAEQAEELKALGADVVLCTETDDIAARVKEVTGGKGAWGAIDAVGGPLTQRISGAVRDGGSVYIYGAMSGLEFTGSIVDCLFRNVAIRGFWLNIYLGSLTPERKAEVFAQVVDMLADGSLAPYSGQKFSLADVVEAVQASQATARAGKVLLVG